ncbi:FitA-like ribbon-helix-helix domain-containing protein [Sphingomonas sp. MMS24-JH45]
MGQILVRQLDDALIARLKARAKTRKTSVEALAQEAIAKAAEATVEEKLAIVERMRAWGERAINRDVPQTPTLDLIREDRDRGH